MRIRAAEVSSPDSRDRLVLSQERPKRGGWRDVDSVWPGVSSSGGDPPPRPLRLSFALARAGCDFYS